MTDNAKPEADDVQQPQTPPIVEAGAIAEYKPDASQAGEVDMETEPQPAPEVNLEPQPPAAVPTVPEPEAVEIDDLAAKSGEPDVLVVETPLVTAKETQVSTEAEGSDVVYEHSASNITNEPNAPEVIKDDPTPNDVAPASARKLDIVSFIRETPPVPRSFDPKVLKAHTRRDFLIYGAGVLAAAAGCWWLLPEETQTAHLTAAQQKVLDSLETRVSPKLAKRSGAIKAKFLDRVLTFDDDVAAALFSPTRSVPTYTADMITPNLRNNYDGQTPDPGYIDTWKLELTGLASGKTENLPISLLKSRFPLHQQITRLVCVEGWSAIAGWGGLRFADLLAAYPPKPGAKWAKLISDVNLDGEGNSDPYFVSIDLTTAMHPQSLLATHHDGKTLELEHGAPLRLIVPMKLGLKNIKAITRIEYSVWQPSDYWNEQGYSKYDGI